MFTQKYSNNIKTKKKNIGIYFSYFKNNNITLKAHLKLFILNYKNNRYISRISDIIWLISEIVFSKFSLIWHVVNVCKSVIFQTFSLMTLHFPLTRTFSKLFLVMPAKSKRNFAVCIHRHILHIVLSKGYNSIFTSHF